MKETWRWFGSLDKINLSEIAQTGAKGIVTSLHEIPYGQAWSKKKINCLKKFFDHPEDDELDLEITLTPKIFDNIIT